MGVSAKSSSARRSFFVGRPVPRARSMNPLIRFISSNSYCSGGVMFSKTSGSSFGADSFLDGLEHAKRVGDGRFFYSHLITYFNGSRWFSQCTVDGDSSVFTSVGGQCARFVDACCPKPLVNACFGIHRSMREWGIIDCRDSWYGRCLAGRNF